MVKERIPEADTIPDIPSPIFQTSVLTINQSNYDRFMWAEKVAKYGMFGDKSIQRIHPSMLFLAEDESLSERLRIDDEYVTQELGLTHAQLAQVIKKVKTIGKAVWNKETEGKGLSETIGYITTHLTLGEQKADLFIRRRYLVSPLHLAGNSFLHEGRLQYLVKVQGKPDLSFNDIHEALIRDGFYGGKFNRVEPKDIITVLGINPDQISTLQSQD